VIILLSGGLAVSCLGLYFGLRRLKSDVMQLAGRLRKTGKVGGVSRISS